MINVLYQLINEFGSPRHITVPAWAEGISCTALAPLLGSGGCQEGVLVWLDLGCLSWVVLHSLLSVNY